MNHERGIGSKFSIDGEYTCAEFVSRCKDLMRQLSANDPIREWLAIYIGWAERLPRGEKIGWTYISDGSITPYVMRVSTCVAPNGMEF